MYNSHPILNRIIYILYIIFTVSPTENFHAGMYNIIVILIRDISEAKTDLYTENYLINRKTIVIWVCIPIVNLRCTFVIII